jgi:hypothetical protein
VSIEQRRIVRLAESSVTLEMDLSGDVQRVANVVLPAVSESDAAATPLNVTLRLESDGSDHLVLRRGELPVAKSGDAGHVATVLMDEVARALTSNCRRGLLFHAAAVGWRDHVVVLPGGTGAGKSTLAASLVRRGLTLLGDEIACLDDRHIVGSFARPFAFKPRGLAVARRWLAIEDAAGQTLETRLATLVPPCLIGRFDYSPAWSAAAIVFPEWEEGRRFEVRPLSRAETALGLMASLVNARNLPGHGLADVVRLAQQIPGYRLRYSDADEVAIEALVTLSSSGCLRNPVV